MSENVLLTRKNKPKNCKEEKTQMTKKIFIFVMAIALIMGLSFSVQAMNTVQMTLSNPTITKTGCEKVGAVTFSFDSGSVLTVGDWWYMDLQTGATLCSGIDFLITGGAANAVTANANNVNAVFGNTAGNDSLLENLTAGGNAAIRVANVGPVTVTNESGTGVNGAVKAPITANMCIKVVGAANGRRVTLYVMGDDNATPGTITVQAGYKMNIKILDGAAHNAAAALGDSMILLDANANTIYNEAAGDVITGNAVPHLQNTLCVNSEQMSGSVMYTYFSSLNDKFTFTGDSAIAHTAAAASISLAACKGETEGNIQIAAQGGCAINYETAAGYCLLDTFNTQTMPWAAVGGNKLLIQNASVFGEAAADQWQVYMYSDTPGVYFTAAPGYLNGYTPAQDACLTAYGGGAATGAAWVAYNEGGTAGAAYPAAGACTVAAANRVRELRSTAFAAINTFDTLELDIPALCYDTSIVGDATQADIRISLRRYPCGEIFSETRTIGTFVTTCPPAAGATNLLFPFLPAMDGSVAGWWGGFLIVNGSATPGTAALTFTEEDGDSATFTTPSIAAGGMWVGNVAALLSTVTPNPGNTGTFGDSNVSIVAACNFTFGGGFAFTGNGDEGTGYVAYTSIGSGWN
jgi:hypothetical protein